MLQGKAASIPNLLKVLILVFTHKHIDRQRNLSTPAAHVRQWGKYIATENANCTGDSR